jgi:phosphoribosylglycinamide formyltransferase-1
MPEAPLRLGVLASGRGSNLQAILDAASVRGFGAAVVVVVSDQKDSAALERARRGRVPAVFLDPVESSSRDAYDERIVGVLKEHRVDLVVLAGYMRIATAVLVGAFRNRIINIHPSLLPSFPGLRAQKKALEWGVRISGCTVHFVEETVDSGPIILQAAVPVRGDDTEETLAARILAQEHRILPQAIRYFAEGRLELNGRRVSVRGETTAPEQGILSPPPDHPA